MSGTQSILFSFALALLLAAPSAAQNGKQGPPGLVLIEGGKTEIGTEVKVIEELILHHEGMAGAFLGETPRHKIELDDYYLMPTEVTNEQYAAFVRATGGKPAYTWADAEVVNSARREFLEAEGLKAVQAREEGKRYDRKKFDQRVWWEDNWEGTGWDVPKDDLNKPVVYVTFQDALDYAQWAGLRLMTEAEYEHAARGNSEDPYPWGTEWNKDACANRDLGIDDVQPVAQYPKGARNGIHDLIGNVWEWTSSHYRSYPKYETLKIKEKGKGKRQIVANANFDSNQRVSRGGGFSNGESVCRASVRRGTERVEATNGLGFRCASSASPGKDMAMAMIGNQVDLKLLDPDVEFATERPTVLQRWTSEDGTVDVEGYQVVTSYERIVFTPVKEIDAANVNTLSRLTETEGPALLGFFATDVPIVEPALEPGTYFVTFRSEAKMDEEDEDAAAAEVDLDGPGFDDFADAAGFVAEANSFIVHDQYGTPLVAIPATAIPVHDKPKGPGSFSVLPFVPPTEEELEQMEKDGVEPPPARDTLMLKAQVFDRTSRKAFHFDVPLLIAPNSIDSSWH